MKNQYIGGDCLKEGRWTVFRFKRGLGEKEGLVFLRGGEVMSKYILPSSVWKFLGIRDVGWRDCKYLKNNKWLKHEIFQIPLK